MAKFSTGDIVKCINYRHCCGKNSRIYRTPGRVVRRDFDYYLVEYDNLPGTRGVSSYWLKSQFLDLVEREFTPVSISMSLEELFE